VCEYVIISSFRTVTIFTTLRQWPASSIGYDNSPSFHHIKDHIIWVIWYDPYNKGLIVSKHTFNIWTSLSAKALSSSFTVSIGISFRMYSFFVLIFEHRKTVPYAPLPINENKYSYLPEVGPYGFNYCFSWIIRELTFKTCVETG